MTEIIEFLLARLDEKERDAGDVHLDSCNSVLPLPGSCDCGYPARVLTEVAAHRQIIAEHTPKDRTGKHLCPVCVSWEIWLTQEPGESLPLDYAPCTTMRLLALPDAAHEGYRQEWAP